MNGVVQINVKPKLNKVFMLVNNLPREENNYKAKT